MTQWIPDEVWGIVSIFLILYILFGLMPNTSSRTIKVKDEYYSLDYIKWKVVPRFFFLVIAFAYFIKGLLGS